MKEKEYECVEVKHHKDVGKTIAEYQKNGAGTSTPTKLLAWREDQGQHLLIITCYVRKISSDSLRIGRASATSVTPSRIGHVGKDICRAALRN